MTIRRHRSLVTLAAALSAISLGLVASCGIPLDDEPRTIAQTTITPTTETPTTISLTTDAPEVSVYFLRGESLERQGYPVEDEPTVQQAVAFVLEPPAGGTSPALRSSVPPGTALRSIEVAGGAAIIDLTAEISDVSGPAQKEAFAQIVFTTLAFDDIDRVRFLVDGEAIDAPSDDGNLAVVRAENYDAPLNPR